MFRPLSQAILHGGARCHEQVDGADPMRLDTMTQSA